MTQSRSPLRLLSALLLTLLLAACGGVPDPDPLPAPVQPGAAPEISAEFDATPALAEPGTAGYRVALRYGGADDPGLSLRWTLVEAPDGSQATLERDTGPEALLLPDLPGSYEVALTVTGADGVVVETYTTAVILPAERSDRIVPEGPAHTSAYLCPVNGPVSFTDTYGAPRPGGRTHKGIDMFAARGTPTVAVTGGRAEPRNNSLGGLAIKLWGSDGRAYYYAHHDRNLIGSSTSVARGRQVGTVGTSGNAAGTPPHLHFEIKTGSGVNINPYGSLRSWCSGGSGCNRSWPTLRRGSAPASATRSAQYLLRARGYSLAVDGAFGPQTERVVRSFQRAHGLAVDGIVGPQTWSRLIVVVREGDRGDAVRAVQRRLGITVDGVFGPQTRRAVRAFQERNGLGVDGVVGPNTWAELVGGNGCR